MTLALEGITHGYDGPPVVRDLDLTLAPGEVVCLLGPSGCGKTTTLRLAAGLERPWQGRVTLDGVTVADATTFVPPEKRGVGLLFQDFALFPHLSVADNVAFGLRRRDDGQIGDLLARVDLAGRQDAFPHQLSGGQQQRVALARALAPGPRLMLLDEPFSGLDTVLRHRVREQTLELLKAAGVATLMVTHDPEEAMFMADRVALMRDGAIVQAGAPIEVYRQPAHVFAVRLLGEVNELEAEVVDGELRCALGRWPAPAPACRLLIRPEGLVPAESGPIAATVAVARPRGRDTWLALDAGGARLHAVVPGTLVARAGDPVALRLDPDQAFLVDADGRVAPLSPQMRPAAALP